MFQLIFNSRTDGRRLKEHCQSQGTAELLLNVDATLEELQNDEDELQEEEDAPA
jgi:hypothetical protein